MRFISSPGASDIPILDGEIIEVSFLSPPPPRDPPLQELFLLPSNLGTEYALSSFLE